MREHIDVVTDGSAIGNPGPGGWAAILKSGRIRWQVSGSVKSTTASTMELTAVLEAFKTLQAGSRVTVWSDSQYLIGGMRHLAERWSRHGWLNRRGLPIPDQDLWMSLLDLRRHHSIRWRWVRGHNGHPVQTQADALAYKEARRQQVTLRLAA